MYDMWPVLDRRHLLGHAKEVDDDYAGVEYLASPATDTVLHATGISENTLWNIFVFGMICASFSVLLFEFLLIGVPYIAQVFKSGLLWKKNFGSTIQYLDDKKDSFAKRFGPFFAKLRLAVECLTRLFLFWIGTIFYLGVVGIFGTAMYGTMALSSNIFVVPYVVFVTPALIPCAQVVLVTPIHLLCTCSGVTLARMCESMLLSRDKMKTTTIPHQYLQNMQFGIGTLRNLCTIFGVIIEGFLLRHPSSLAHLCSALSECTDVLDNANDLKGAMAFPRTSTLNQEEKARRNEFVHGRMRDALEEVFRKLRLYQIEHICMSYYVEEFVISLKRSLHVLNASGIYVSLALYMIYSVMQWPALAIKDALQATYTGGIIFVVIVRRIWEWDASSVSKIHDSSSVVNPPNGIVVTTVVGHDNNEDNEEEQNERANTSLLATQTVNDGIQRGTAISVIPKRVIRLEEGERSDFNYDHKNRQQNPSTVFLDRLDFLAENTQAGRLYDMSEDTSPQCVQDLSNPESGIRLFAVSWRWQSHLPETAREYMQPMSSFQVHALKIALVEAGGSLVCWKIK